MESPTNKSSNIQKNLSKNMIDYRKKLKFSQARLAEKADLSNTIISDYENERKEPKLSSVKKIADVFGITLDELCNINPDIQNKNSWKNHLAAASIIILEEFKAQVHVENNNIILTLSPENDCSEYSSKTILQFFEEYETIQKISSLNPPSSTLNVLKEKLIKDYQDLPNFQPYQFPKEKTTNME